MLECLIYSFQEMIISSGRAIGGSSLISNLLYSRGNSYDFEKLRDLGLNYNDALAYFKKAEAVQEKSLSFSGMCKPICNMYMLNDCFNHSLSCGVAEFHSRDGHQAVSFMRGTNLARDFIAAGTELGLKSLDYNAAQQVGVAVTQANTLRGGRQSVADAYLRPVRDRPNLDVVINTEAIKVTASSQPMKPS